MTWRVADSLLKLREQVDAAAPNRAKNNDGTIGDAAHASRSSDHNPWVKDGEVGVVTAMDITHDPNHGVDTYKFAEHLRQAKDLRIKYVISNKRIFSTSVQPWDWRPYHGQNPHDEHVHISVKEPKSLYDLKTDWDLGDLGTYSVGAPASNHPVLRHDSTGFAVATVQQLLKVTPEYVQDDRGALQRLSDKIKGTTLSQTPWFGPRTKFAVRNFQAAYSLVVDGIVGAQTWKKLETQGSKSPLNANLHRDITATVFGGADDLNTSAYTGKILDDTAFYVALPYRFIGTRPRVMITNRANSKTGVGTVEDIGPWNTNDPYWTQAGGRPQAETGWDMRRRPTNHAGIDLSPALAKQIGIDGKGSVDWTFE